MVTYAEALFGSTRRHSANASRARVRSLNSCRKSSPMFLCARPYSGSTLIDLRKYSRARCLFVALCSSPRLLYAGALRLFVSMARSKHSRAFSRSRNSSSYSSPSLWCVKLSLGFCSSASTKHRSASSRSRSPLGAALCAILMADMGGTRGASGSSAVAAPSLATPELLRLAELERLPRLPPCGAPVPSAASWAGASSGTRGNLVARLSARGSAVVGVSPSSGAAAEAVVTSGCSGNLTRFIVRDPEI
mmetsp:Transcript_11398/g.35420  ORF Transcript_11398/g.35420 Transcript_11398/m.35420 type:complete len:248 (+) Transcript_11398:1100-1843(+)